MKTYQSDIHASVGGIYGAGEKCKYEISQVCVCVCVCEGGGYWLWAG